VCTVVYRIERKTNKGSANKEQATPLKASDKHLKEPEGQLLEGVLVVKNGNFVLAQFDMKTKEENKVGLGDKL